MHLSRQGQPKQNMTCVLVCVFMCMCVLTNHRRKHNHAMTLRQTVSKVLTPPFLNSRQPREPFLKEQKKK